MFHPRTMLAMLLSLVCFAHHVSIAAPTQEDPFEWVGQLSQSKCSIGDTVMVSIRLGIAKNHYVYAKRTTVSPISQKGFYFGKAEYIKPLSKRDPLTGQEEKIYEDSTEVGFAAIPLVSAPSKAVIQVAVSYQGCTQKMCFIPQDDTLTLHLQVLDAKEPSTVVTTKKDAGLVDRIRQGGIIAILVAAMLGLLTCLTPCVYPLIPVTISVFGAQATKTRLQAFSLSLVYVLGIAVTFSILGFAAASTGAIFGQILSNPMVAIGIAVVFAIFAISLFGAFDLQLPSSIQIRLVSVKGNGYRKTFLMGTVAGFIAAPCTGPSLGAILAYVAGSGNQAFGFFMLLAFALGLGFPFLILGTFSSLLAARPKPGPWMDAVKSILGIVMLVVAFYVLQGGPFPQIRRLFRSTPEYYLSGGLMIVLGIVAGGVHLSYHHTSITVRLRKTVGIALIVLGAVGVVGGILLPAGYTDKAESSGTGQSGISWIHDLEAGLQTAREQGKPAVVDFWATWCVACKELEKFTFSDLRVQKELARFVCIKSDLTKRSSNNKRIAARYRLLGLPTIDFFSGDGKRLPEKRVIGFMGAEPFLKHIKDIQ